MKTIIPILILILLYSTLTFAQEKQQLKCEPTPVFFFQALRGADRELWLKFIEKYIGFYHFRDGSMIPRSCYYIVPSCSIDILEEFREKENDPKLD